MTIEEIKEGLKKNGYIPNDDICYAVFAALSLNKPILIEGDPGVGKTSLAIAVAKMLGLPFLRLQMYDGLTKDDILYDYDYQRQLLTLEAVKPKINEEIKDMDVNSAIRKVAGDVNFYGKEFLIPRPVLQTINGTGRKLLLIDEIDKSSEETEYMLYEYLDFLTTLSWKKAPATEIDLNKAEEILNENHYGLKKVKDRIIEQLAVMALNKKQSGSILLFVGAPGTGKTSIGQSIAKALGREYVRISLGGVRDEAEIRGHRRTYVGAMPGRIMEGMKRCGVQNPVMVLDEVDKLVKEYGGDPASALLEVLDPEQNTTFTDHYMNVPYDLSDVLFVCTANTVDTIPEPLLNRMEVISFSGYTPLEKFQIAKKHLLPKAMKRMGITASRMKVTDEALKKIIDGYTAEAGVRGLKKQLDTLCRHAAVK